MIQLSTKVIYTAVIGPNSLFREGLARVLRSPYQAKIVAETVDTVQQIGELDLIVIVAGADQAALLAELRRAKEENAPARVVVVGDIDPPEIASQLLVAGADGYLLRTVSLEALLASLDVVMLGGTVVLPTPRSAFAIGSADCAYVDTGSVEAEIPKLDAEAEYKKLSDREMEVLLCLTKGESNKQIARKFGIAEATVKVHLKAILRKIRVSNRTQAAVWAHRNYVARPARLPKTAPLDFGEHEDRLRPSIVVPEGVLVVPDMPSALGFSCSAEAARDAAGRKDVIDRETMRRPGSGRPLLDSILETSPAAHPISSV